MTESNGKLKGANSATKKYGKGNGMERTKLTDWSKLAKSKDTERDSTATVTSNGAVRPGPIPWKKTKSKPVVNTEKPDELSKETRVQSAAAPGGSINVLGPGSLSGFNLPDNYGSNRRNDKQSETPSIDNTMMKIGFGVFGGIALILGTMLSVFYIQKKRKDERIKRRKVRQQSPLQYQHLGGGQVQLGGQPPGGGANFPVGYDGVGYDPSVAPFIQQGNQVNMSQMMPGQVMNYNNFYQHYPTQFDNDYVGPMPYNAAEQFYNQQAYEQNYYQMCQDYILRQRQMQMESNVEPQEIGGQHPPYNQAVLDYIERIGDNLKTPKAKQRKDGNSTPHPIITRRASMKSLAQSELSCWTEDNVSIKGGDMTEGKDKDSVSVSDGKSLAQSELGSQLDVDDIDRDNKSHHDATSQKSDSAYGSRGSIQSPNSPPNLEGVHMFETDHSNDESHEEEDEEDDKGCLSDRELDDVGDDVNVATHADDSDLSYAEDSSSRELQKIGKLSSQTSTGTTKTQKKTTFKSDSELKTEIK